MFQSLHLCRWVWFLFRSRLLRDGQEGWGTSGGISLSRRVRVRRADVSKCASEEEEAPSSPGAAWPGTSGHGAREESFPDCPQLMV